MTLHSSTNKLPDFFCVCIGNSKLINSYTESFINFTVNFQVNDVRQIPIVVPTPGQINTAKNIYNSAVSIKKDLELGIVTKDVANKVLEQLQIVLDDFIYSLYSV